MQKTIIPGLAFSLIVGAACVFLQRLVPGLSALLVAIIAGIAVANLTRVPDSLTPGIAVASKRVLRIGIVLLGLSILLDDIVALGWGVVAVVIAVVFGGLFGTILIGRWLGVTRSQSVLIGAGFSICGAAAVAGVESTIKRKDSEVATAIGLVVLYGTAMIAIVPLLLGLTGFDDHLKGLIAGASIHEVAQVVAAGGVMGGGVLTVAVIVKLARVLMLAPVIATLGFLERGNNQSDKRAPLIPLFAVGFIAASVVASLVDIPDSVSTVISLLQSLFLAAAMFALGAGIRFSSFKQAGMKPVVLGALSTLIVAVIATTGMILVS